MKLRKGALVVIDRGGTTQLAIVEDPDREGARVAIRSWSESSKAWSQPREILRRFVLEAPKKDDARIPAAKAALAEEQEAAKAAEEGRIR